MDISQNILDSIKCVICNEYQPDCLQCYNGHTHCVKCFKYYETYQRQKAKLKCTVCMSKRGWCKNRQIVQLAEQIQLKVPCNIGECKEHFCVNELGNHRKTCSFKKFKCPIGCNDCKTFSIRELPDHIYDHSKTLLMKDTDVLNLQISETVHYGPRTILLNDRTVIQLECYVVFDRRCGSKLIVKCYVIDNECEKSNTNIIITNTDMLSGDYIKFYKNLSGVEDFDVKNFDDTCVIPSLYNYVEVTDHCILSEQVIDVHKEYTHAVYNIRNDNIDEDYQEIYTLKINFEVM